MWRADRSSAPAAAWTISIIPAGPMLDAERDNPDLERACIRASGLDHAMDELLCGVADLLPTDPRHEAAYGAAAMLRPLWVEAVDDAAAMVAITARDLRMKSKLIQNLIERDERDEVVGGPLARLSAGLADDLLALTSS